MNGSPNGITRVLVITNIIMAVAVCVMVARGLFNEPEDVYATGGAAGGKYIAVPIQYTTNREALLVIDTSTDVMIAYNLDARGDKIYPSSGRTIDQDFKLVTKLDNNYFSGGTSSTKNLMPQNIRKSLEGGKD